MDIETTENAVLDRLKDRVPQLQIEAFPDDPANYQLLHPLGALLVRFFGEGFSDPKPTGPVIQAEKMEFEVVIVARHLRTHQGIYAYIGLVKAALTGKFDLALPRAYLTRVRFVSVNSGVWQYSVTFAFNSIHEEEES